MIPGYNHNVKYQERVFHVQTEDSGLEMPHVITHVFLGGTIVATIKTSYADALQRDDIVDWVTRMMQMQHKQVLKNLIHGSYDTNIDALRDFAATLSGPKPINVEHGQNRSSFGRQIHDEAPPPFVQPDATVETPPIRRGPPPRLHQTPPRAASVPPPLPQHARTQRIQEPMYVEAQLLEADDKAVDSLFSTLISEKTLDEVIFQYLKKNSSK